MKGLIIGLAVVGLGVAAFASAAQAQGGSAGGTIGNRGKSVSGGEADPAPSPSRKRSVKRKSSSDDGPRVEISGTWFWKAECERGVKNFEGLMTFTQTGNTFSAYHHGTNLFDSGELTNTRMSGSRISFNRKWGRFNDLVELTVSGSSMSGEIKHTDYAGHCDVKLSKR